MSTDLNRLEGETRRRVDILLAACAALGFDVRVISTGRTFAEQADLYAQGRTKDGQIVTNAKPGTSWHNFGRAVDLAPVTLLGKPNWAPDDPLWTLLGMMGEQAGLEWGGRWRKPDKPHFQYRKPYTTTAEARADLGLHWGQI